MPPRTPSCSQSPRGPCVSAQRLSAVHQPRTDHCQGTWEGCTCPARELLLLASSRRPLLALSPRFLTPFPVLRLRPRAHWRA